MRNYVISDLHLNHRNIIRHCNRPFSSVEEMNRALVDNWNKTVNSEDTVFFLGDLAFGYYPYGWLKELNGHIVLIKGSHDSRGISSVTLNSGAVEFLLIHKPPYVNGWKGWTIHGHVHNKDLVNYPYINREKRRVNVSAELINYTPKRLSEIVEAIRDDKTACR